MNSSKSHGVAEQATRNSTQTGSRPNRRSRGLKEELTLGKALGFLACTTIVAVTYWSLSDGQHTNRAAAGDERFDAGRAPSDSRAAAYKTVAARMMDQIGRA